MSKEEKKNIYTGRYAIVAAEFYSDIIEDLVSGAKEFLLENGINEEQIDNFPVPGAFEIPFVVRKLIDRTRMFEEQAANMPHSSSIHYDNAKNNRYDAIITLGAVVRGETPHFDYVAGECARSVSRFNAWGVMPIVFGVLTTDTLEQAQKRADPKRGNKGAAAAETALAMVRLNKETFGF